MLDVLEGGCNLPTLAMPMVFLESSISRCMDCLSEHGTVKIAIKQ